MSPFCYTCTFHNIIMTMNETFVFEETIFKNRYSSPWLVDGISDPKRYSILHVHFIVKAINVSRVYMILLTIQIQTYLVYGLLTSLKNCYTRWTNTSNKVNVSVVNRYRFVTKWVSYIKHRLSHCFSRSFFTLSLSHFLSLSALSLSPSLSYLSLSLGLSLFLSLSLCSLFFSLSFSIVLSIFLPPSLSFPLNNRLFTFLISKK